MGRKGFTLTELLIVISILAVMAIILVGIINPIALVNKGKDARRKKDLARIKTAFEEYHNDKGCYPRIGSDLGEYDLNNVINCGSLIVFAPWLVPWPCDPDGEPYEIVVDPDSACPNEYRAFTTLDFLADRDIPDGWGVTAHPIGGSGNYGISSPNVSWYELTNYPSSCSAACNFSCQVVAGQPPNEYWVQSDCSGSNCYWAQGLECQIDNCPDGVDWAALRCGEGR